MRRILWLVLQGCSFQPTVEAVVDASSQGDAAHDAPADAPALVCPMTDGWMTIGAAHYYVSPTGSDKTWWTAESDCEKRALPGGSATHLAVIQSNAEAVAVAAILAAPTTWIGMFQPNGEALPTAGWSWITGAPGIGTDWAAGEPSDLDGVENGAENFAEIYVNGTLNDVAGTDVLHYICGCDGVATSATAAAQVPPEPP